MRSVKFIVMILLLVVTVFVLAGCSPGLSEAQKRDQRMANEQLDQFQQSQPTPRFNASQLRQNLIDIETAQAEATVTTSFFFNLGVADPIHTCPSIGFPIPGTFQLTAPSQGVKIFDGGAVAVPQLEANGVYTGDTSATTVICIDSNGNGYAKWWEGFVSTTAAPATWNFDTKQIVLTGEPTAEFSTGQ